MRIIDKVASAFGYTKKKENRGGSSTVQTRDGHQHPFSGSFDKYIPLKYQYDLYKVMREAVPVLDTAINRIVRLVGEFDIECENERQAEEIKDFIKNVKVNSNQRGLNHFIESYLDQLIESGNSVGEIVLNNAKNDIYALKNVDIRSIKLKNTENPLENVICQIQEGKAEPVELPYQDLIMFTPLDPEGDSPYGTSLFRSMPFMTGILLNIFNSIGLNWERFGNLKYSVVYNPPKDSDLSPEEIKERMEMMENAFKRAMEANKNGKAADFYGVGDIEVKVIGADNQILDSSVPVKQVLEQLVSSTGLPPFLLGLSWSTTERMSQQQADFLTSELENYREEIAPVVRYVIDMWQRVTGKNIEYELVWNNINLQDEVELARAELIRQQAREKEINNKARLRNENIIDQQMMAEELGYENPVGDAPQPIQIVEETEEVEENKSMGLKIITKSPFNAPPEDEKQLEIERDTFEGYMKCVKRLEKKILKIVPDIQEEKSFIKNKALPPNYQEKVNKAIEEFVKDMIGRGSGYETIEGYGTYGTYSLHAFGYGTRRAVESIKDEFGEERKIEVTPSYEHPQVQELLNDGMELVVTKAKEKMDDILLIMAEHAQVGENPVEWARALRKELKETISDERWYWERLARSESAMAIDRGEISEYQEQGFNYCEWNAAPDACNICLGLDGKMWHISEAKMVVVDTHPHCRCRKLPRTKRQYDDWKGNN